MSKELNIQETHLKNIEDILRHSMNGTHLLFNHDKVAEILSVPTENINFFSKKNMKKIEGLFNELVLKKSLEDKQYYLSSLATEEFEIVVRLYFNILENSLKNASTTTH